MFDITGLGELLIDFTQSGYSQNGMRLFEQNPGGAVANVLSAAARFGLKTAFIGKVGSDMQGEFLKYTLEDAGINTSGLIQTGEAFTTLAFVALSDTGERSFSFARKPGADTLLKKEEVKDVIIKNTRILHIGSLSLTNEPAREATIYAVKTAKKAGAVISYDPNYRPSLWKSSGDAKERMRSIVEFSDIIKLSEEEIFLLTGTDDPDKACLRLYRQGVKYTAVTAGKNGAYIGAYGETAHVPGFLCNVVDTTGAGDAFMGGFLSRLLGSQKKTGEHTLEELKEYIRFGNAAAACCIGKHGGIPAMPSSAEVEKLLKG